MKETGIEYLIKIVYNYENKLNVVWEKNFMKRLTRIELLICVMKMVHEMKEHFD